MEMLNKTKIIQELSVRRISLLTAFDFKKLFKIENDNTAYKSIARLAKAGVLKRLTSKKYLFTLNPADDFTIANFLYPPSYVSLESALSFYGIIDQFPYQIASVTPRKTKTIHALGKVFAYTHLRPKFFWGYEKKEAFMLALAEKALLDYLYLCTKGLRNFYKDEYNLNAINTQKLILFADKTGHKQLQMYIKKNNLC